jgi:hypothetical protein
VSREKLEDLNEQWIIDSPYYSVMQHLNAVLLYLQFDCIGARMYSVSITKKKHHCKRDDETNFLTVLCRNPSLKYCAPLFPI